MDRVVFLELTSGLCTNKNGKLAVVCGIWYRRNPLYNTFIADKTHREYHRTVCLLFSNLVFQIMKIWGKNLSLCIRRVTVEKLNTITTDCRIRSMQDGRIWNRERGGGGEILYIVLINEKIIWNTYKIIKAFLSWVQK